MTNHLYKPLQMYFRLGTNIYFIQSQHLSHLNIFIISAHQTLAQHWLSIVCIAISFFVFFLLSRLICVNWKCKLIFQCHLKANMCWPIKPSTGPKYEHKGCNPSQMIGNLRISLVMHLKFCKPRLMLERWANRCKPMMVDEYSSIS